MAVTKTEMHISGDRYQFDWKLRALDGWVQLDTDQDASYYGHWASPSKLTIIAFIEGDVIKHVCDTIEEWQQEVLRYRDWHVGQDGWMKADCGCVKELEEQFTFMEVH